MSANVCIPVAHECMGRGFDFDVHPKRLTVTHSGPNFTYRQHGRTHVSRDPLAYVEINTNDGTWQGAARLSDLRFPSVAVGAAVPEHIA